MKMLHEDGSPIVHQSSMDVLKWFECDHLPEDLQAVAKPFLALATDMVTKGIGPQVTLGLHNLLASKDCFVRAAIELKRAQA